CCRPGRGGARRPCSGAGPARAASRSTRPGCPSPARPWRRPPGRPCRRAGGGRGGTHLDKRSGPGGEIPLSGSPSRACPHPSPLPLGERVLGLFCRVIVGEFQPVGLTGCVLASHRDAPSLYTGGSCTPGRSSCLFLERALFCLRSNE